MSNKYGEAIGLWALRVGGFEKDLKPQKGDNLKLTRIMGESKKRKDESWLMEQLGIFIKELIERDYPPLDDKEREDLEMYVEFNLIALIEELLVAFRWTTKKEIESLGVDGIKKAMLQVQKN